MTNNRSGFTLVEFLVAIVILMVGMLGLLQAINIAMQRNLDNTFRNEAINVADTLMMAKRAKTFDALSTTVASPPWKNTTRYANGILKNYSTQEIISLQTERSKQIVVNVAWKKKGVRSTHSISSFVSTF